VSTTTTAELGQSPTIPTAAIPAAIVIAATAVVQPYPYYIATAGCHLATTTVSHQQLSMLQLREDG
jgi:ABC-type arginine transport system permease subunit